MRALTSEVLPACDLGAETVAALYALYDEHYLGADPDRFRADLAEKHWVILLRDEEGAPAGFSTQMRLEGRCLGEPVTALFSGDTVIRRDCWGTQELARAWRRLAGRLKAEVGKDRSLYWLLISKGHRTYLYLPLFFNAFYPRYDEPTPPREQQVMDSLCEAKFGRAYEAEKGLIRWPSPHDRLRPDLDTAPMRLDNPHVRYFMHRNPDYAEGVELVCLAEIDAMSMRGGARRDLQAGMLEGPLPRGA